MPVKGLHSTAATAIALTDHQFCEWVAEGLVFFSIDRHDDRERKNLETAIFVANLAGFLFILAGCFFKAYFQQIVGAVFYAAALFLCMVSGIVAAFANKHIVFFWSRMQEYKKGKKSIHTLKLREKDRFSSPQPATGNPAFCFFHQVMRPIKSLRQ